MAKKWRKRGNESVEAYESVLFGDDYAAYAHVVAYKNTYLVEVSCYCIEFAMGDIFRLSKAIALIDNVPFVSLRAAQQFAGETMKQMIRNDDFRKAIEVNNDNQK